MLCVHGCMCIWVVFLCTVCGCVSVYLCGVWCVCVCVPSQAASPSPTWDNTKHVCTALGLLVTRQAGPVPRYRPACGCLPARGKCYAYFSGHHKYAPWSDLISRGQSGEMFQKCPLLMNTVFANTQFLVCVCDFMLIHFFPLGGKELHL